MRCATWRGWRATSPSCAPTVPSPPSSGSTRSATRSSRRFSARISGTRAAPVYNRGMSVHAPAATVALGIHRLLTDERRLVQGRRVGVLCNPASIDGSFRHTADLLFEAPSVTLGAIFGPQHGFRADVQDNMIETAHASDARLQVPVYSLYSEVREPTQEMLRGL